MSSLAAWLAGIRAPEDVDKRLDSGFWREQTIYQTLQSWRALDPANRRLHYWRDRAAHEVDFILEQSGKLVAIEIKSGSQVSLSDASGIQTLKGALKKSQRLVCGVVLHAGKARPLDQDIFALPWGWMVKE
jgi:predicted AAA+ superfamily ATPase